MKKPLGCCEFLRFRSVQFIFINMFFYYGCELSTVSRSSLASPTSEYRNPSFTTELRNKLRLLENKLINDADWELYSQHLERFYNLEEHIEFLELPSYIERINWLNKNGFAERFEKLKQKYSSAIASKSLTLNMPMFIVEAMLGEPHAIDISGDRRLKNQRWTFKKNRDIATQRESMTIVSFERGVVVGWHEETRKTRRKN